MSPSSPSRARALGLLAALYFAQGLPYGFFTQALPVLLREAGHSVKVVSALGFLYLPWALKFLWAPYLDHTASRRRWLLGFQVASVTIAATSSLLDLRGLPAILLVVAFVFNLVAASQDVVTDAIAVRLLGPSEKGLGNAIQVGGYRIGMILGGGLLLWVFAKGGWSVMFACMAGLLAPTLLPVVAKWNHDETPPGVTRPRAQGLWRAWLARARTPGMLKAAGLIVCYRFGDAMLSNVLGPFLKDSGLTKETIALMKGTVGSATSLLGALLGGFWVFRLTRRAALVGAGLAQAATFVLYLAATAGRGGVGLLWAATVAEGVIGSVATVALFSLMMDASDPEHAGSDYTLLASFVILVGSVATFVSAAIVDAFGYVAAFSVATTLATLGTLVVGRYVGRP